MQYPCMRSTTAGTATSCWRTSGLTSRWRSADAYSSRTALRDEEMRPEAAMVVDSSPSRRLCLLLLE